MLDTPAKPLVVAAREDAPAPPPQPEHPVRPELDQRDFGSCFQLPGETNAHFADRQDFLSHW